MEINIRAARTRLSRLIDQVNAGEEVVITRHGRPVARLGPDQGRSRARPACSRAGATGSLSAERSAL